MRAPSAYAVPAARPGVPVPTQTRAPLALSLRSVAAGTVPPQPPQHRRTARRLGAAVLGLGLAAVAAVAAYRLFKPGREPVQEPSQPPSEIQPPAENAAARYLNGAAAVLSFSVVSDSALEHYRGAYHNPAMFLAPTVAAAAFANSLQKAVAPASAGPGGDALAGIALMTGLGGFGFHVYNLTKREGRISLLNLFYGAPLGAPFALALSGLAGLTASRLAAAGARYQPGSLFGQDAAALTAAASAVAMIGTVAEAGLYHFRGAYQNPVMYVPVSLPAATAIALAATVIDRRWAGWAKRLLQATAAMGVTGAGFHAYGIHRRMGGFHNWSQNLLSGPPLPAPPSFTGVALAGLGALKLMEAI